MLDQGKRCSKCGEDKPHSAFPRDRHTPSGWKCSCKDCSYAMTAAWKRRNPDYVRPPRDYIKEREQQCKYRAGNPEAQRERWQRYYARNREKIASHREAYWLARPDAAVRKQVRRSIRRESGLSSADISSALLEARVFLLLCIREIRQQKRGRAGNTSRARPG